jgi:hypothetical protein
MTYPMTPGFSGGPTSYAAAISMTDAAVTLRNSIRDFVKERGKATCFDAEAALSLKHPTTSARFRELVMLGRLRATGERQPNERGKLVRVYEACDLPPNFTRVNGINDTPGRSSSPATRAKIKSTVALLGHATADEVCAVTGLLSQTATPAIRDMLFLGMLEETGAKRATRSGRMARVLRVKS